MNKNKYKILKTIKNNKTVFKNISFLSIIKVLEILIPFITYPYVIRTIKLENYGAYLFVFSIISILTVIIKFNLNTHAIKLVSLNSHSSRNLSHIVSCIFSARLYLTLLVCFIGLGTLLIFDFGELEKLYYAFFWLMFSEVFVSVFFFQGIEDLRQVTLMSIVFKVLTAISIFVFIHTPEDYIKLAYITSWSAMIPALYFMFVIRNKYNIKFYLAPLKNVYKYYIDASPFAMASIIGIMTDRGSYIIIGLLFSSSNLALYDVAYKLSNITFSIVNNVSIGFFPKILKLKDNIIKKKVLIIQTLITVVAYLGFVCFGRFVIGFLVVDFEGIEQAYHLLLIVGLIVISYSLSGAIDLFYIVPSGLYSYITKALSLATLSYFVFLIIGLSFIKSSYIVAISLTLSSFIETIYRMIIVKNKILNS